LASQTTLCWTTRINSTNCVAVAVGGPHIRSQGQYRVLSGWSCGDCPP
jgi:hypothetical protein